MYQRLAFTPFLDGHWKPLKRWIPDGDYRWAPPIEIRRNSDNSDLETWFHIGVVDGPILKRFSTCSIHHILGRWRQFLGMCERYEIADIKLGWFSRLFGKCVLEDKIWTDDKERYIGGLELIQSGISVSVRDLRIRIAGHHSTTDLGSFRAWLNALDELHKPFITTERNQTE